LLLRGLLIGLLRGLRGLLLRGLLLRGLLLCGLLLCGLLVGRLRGLLLSWLLIGRLRGLLLSWLCRLLLQGLARLRIEPELARLAVGRLPARRLSSWRRVHGCSFPLFTTRP
jgi:hypothetical protein